MKQLSVSVVMCTYNGERFLRDQLQSIFDQSIAPDEIIIQDDGSTDLTVDIINQLKLETSIPILFEQNESNLGVVLNFEKAISRASKDIVFFSDQDDVWKPNKIEVIKEAFQEKPNVQLIVHNLDFIKDGEVIPDYDFWKHKDFDSNWSRQEILEFLVYRKNAFPGMSMAARKEALSQFLPFNPSLPFMLHDYQIAIYFFNTDEALVINEALAYYRLHSSQVMGKNIRQRQQTNKTSLKDLKQALKRKPIVDQLTTEFNLNRQLVTGYSKFRRNAIFQYFRGLFN